MGRDNGRSVRVRYCAGGDEVMTLDGSDDFSRDDQVLLQVERVNQAVENVHNTVSNICAVLDRIEANQKALAERVAQIVGH